MRPRWFSLLLALSLTACTAASTQESDANNTDVNRVDSNRAETSSLSDAENSVDTFADATDTAETSLTDVFDEDSARDVATDTAPPTCDCFAGNGSYCASRVATHMQSARCTVPVSTRNANALLVCNNGRWTAGETCTAGCSRGETGATDECELPACPCFVRVGWCGASAARHGLTLDPPCQVPLSPAHDDDLLACDGDRWVVRQACTAGCFQAPTGTADYCISTRTPTNPGWAACADRSLIAGGVHPEASDRMRCAGITSSQISQTIGSAPASAGYHAQDGTAGGAPYCAATDLRTGGMTETEIRALLERLAQNGFAAWYRKPGFDGWPSSEAPHIHAVFAGVVMKTELRGQVRDFLLGLNGLASHTRYRFWSPSAASLSIVRLLFSRNYTPP